jgi:hypothetical protein
MLVAAHAAGVSRIDFKISSGKVRQLFLRRAPPPNIPPLPIFLPNAPLQ